MLKNNLKNIFDFYNSKLGNGHKLTKYKLSKLTDIPRTTINRLINNPSASMNMKTLNNLVEFFNVPVNKLLIYKRNPYRFKLMNATNIDPSKLTERVKSRLNRSIALRSVDYHQTIIFTPVINLIMNKRPLNASNYILSNLTYRIDYEDITKYPVYNAIQCANLLNDIHIPLINSISFYLLSYISNISVLHSGLISKSIDDKCKSSDLIATFKGLKSVKKSTHFKLNNLASSSILISNNLMNKKSLKPKLQAMLNGKSNNEYDNGHFLSMVNYYRKHYGKRNKNGYTIKFPNTKLIDNTSINYK